MKKLRLVVRLKGGLGNQMFQYAAARALAIKNGMNLKLDTASGFIRDKVYQRTFSLGAFPIQAEIANIVEQLPFWFERGWNKNNSENTVILQRRPWGTYLIESDLKYIEDLNNTSLHQNTWMEGFWQCEKYFDEYTDILYTELTLPVPQNSNFLSMARKIESSNSVAVGVRLFEEVPGSNKIGVGGLVPFSFYEEAASIVSESINNPTFFIFCTTMNGVYGKLNLPGEIVYITHDNGFEGTIERLWLFNRCQHFIISNSSFYWWGAWLAEKNRSNSQIVACDMFPHQDTIPSRWKSVRAS